MTNPLPAEVLEQRASEQRRRLHNSVAELRSSVRERLDARRLASQYVWQLAGVATVAAMVVGWGVTSIFVRD